MKLNIYCGKTIESKCGKSLHPLNETKQAMIHILKGVSQDLYSNSPDFITTIKYVCDLKSVEYEFFLDGVSCGKDIEPIFDDFNKALTIQAALFLIHGDNEIIEFDIDGSFEQDLREKAENFIKEVMEDISLSSSPSE